MGRECTLQQQAQLVWGLRLSSGGQKMPSLKAELPHANVNISGSTRSEKAHNIII